MVLQLSTIFGLSLSLPQDNLFSGIHSSIPFWKYKKLAISQLRFLLPTLEPELNLMRLQLRMATIYSEDLYEGYGYGLQYSNFVQMCICTEQAPVGQVRR